MAYKQGINPLKDWTMATDEAHSTKFAIKGLKEGEKYFVKVRHSRHGGLRHLACFLVVFLLVAASSRRS